MISRKPDRVTLYDLPDIKARRAVLIGLGKLEKLDLDTLRSMTGNAVKAGIKKELSNLWFALPVMEKLELAPTEAVTALLEGACLGNHLFRRRFDHHLSLRPVRWDR